jgi:hypothetical protein
MMAIEDNFPTMSDSDLATLMGNVTRLSTAGTDRQRIEAERLTPLIAAEQAERRAKLPPKPVRATKKTAAGAKPSTATKTAKPAAKKTVKA